MSLTPQLIDLIDKARAAGKVARGLEFCVGLLADGFAFLLEQDLVVGRVFVRDVAALIQALNAEFLGGVLWGARIDQVDAVPVGEAWIISGSVPAPRGVAIIAWGPAT